MTRDEWKAFHHSIRADARAFGDIHGGYPCFGRDFEHNGAPFNLTRFKTWKGWETHLRRALIRDRPTVQRVAEELRDCANGRADWKANPWRKYQLRRACFMAVKCARAIRLEGFDPGRAEYESDLARRPVYHDGTPRKTWAQLGDLERSTWAAA